MKSYLLQGIFTVNVMSGKARIVMQGSGFYLFYLFIFFVRLGIWKFLENKKGRTVKLLLNSYILYFWSVCNLKSKSIICRMYLQWSKWSRVKKAVDGI